jgi:hypothetical protein
MSLFRTQTVTCPSCGQTKSVDVFYSVNVDRRPDLREAALDRSFQRQTCERCGAVFRIDPDFNYLDLARGQWIAVHPIDALGRWDEIELEDRAAFDKAYGSAAPGAARDIGNGLTVRIVFGWGAFREKLLAADAGLDDREVELLKIAILRNLERSPLSQDVELRLVDNDGTDLILAWMVARSEEPVEMLRVPRSAYIEVEDDREGWKELRGQLSAGPFVDMQRLII